MSRVQLAFLALVPKVTGGISVISSSSVIADVLRDARKRRTTYHRLVLGISVSDAVSSLAFFLGTWPMPQGSSWGAVGNVYTCDVIGFVGQAGTTGTYLYNVVLSTYYLLMLKYRWETSRLKRVEPLLHAFALITSWSIATFMLSKKIYGGAVYVCWIGPYPGDCNSPDTCIRGYNYEMYRWFHYGLVWVSLVYMIIIMCMVYAAVRHHELSSKLSDYVKEEEGKQELNEDNEDDDHHHIGDGDEVKSEEKIDLSRPLPSARVPSRRKRATPSQASSTGPEAQRKAAEQLLINEKTKKSRRIMIQAFLYVGAVFLTWVFISITRILLTLSADLTRTEAVQNYFVFLLLGSFFAPLQGLFNCLIYFRYRIAKKLCSHRRQPNSTTTTPEVEQDGMTQFDLQQWLVSRNNATAGNGRQQESEGGDSQQQQGSSSRRIESLDTPPAPAREDIIHDEYDAENDYY